MTFGHDEAIKMIHDRLDALEASQLAASEAARKQSETIDALAQTLQRLDDTIASFQSFLETWKALQGAQRTVTAVGNGAVWAAKAAGAVLVCWGAVKYIILK